MKEQLNFHFAPLDNHLLDYFIPHSGVSVAFEICTKLVSEVLEKPKTFYNIFLHGPSGVGKRHLSKGLLFLLVQHNIECIIFKISNQDILKIEGSETISFSIPEFISAYQKMKSSGGIIFILGEMIPDKDEIDPHFFSRLFSAHVIEMNYPSDEELYPILVSLLERHHLRLEQKKLKKIIESVPAKPNYFEAISYKINQLIKERGRFTSSMVKEILKNDELGVGNHE